MAAGTWTMTNTSRTKLLDGTFTSGSTWKVALFQNTSNLSTSSAKYSDLTNEVGTTNTGYTTGGAVVTVSLNGTTSVTWSFAANPTWTAGSANLVAKWAAIYKTTGNTDILCFCTLDSGGADVTCNNGNTLTIDSDGTPSPVFTLA